MREGIRLNEIGRWEWERPDGGRSEVSSGDVVEVFAFGDWLPGRVEHSRRLGYYFLDPETGAQLVLTEGLRMRYPGGRR